MTVRALHVWFTPDEVDDCLAYVEYLYDRRGLVYKGWGSNSKEHAIGLIRGYLPSVTAGGLDVVIRGESVGEMILNTNKETPPTGGVRMEYTELIETGVIPGWNNL